MRWRYFFTLEDVYWRRWIWDVEWRDFVDVYGEHRQYWTVYIGPFVWLVGRVSP